MIRTHKIRIYPSKRQATMMRRHIGFQRVAHNHMLAEFKDALECDCEPACKGKDKKACGKSEFLSAWELRKRFNAVKRELYPWARELAASVGDAAAENLKAAINKWVDQKLPNEFPTFKKYHSARSYQASDGHWERNKVDGRKVFLPKVGWVKMREPLRYEGKVRKITVSRSARGWQAAISVEIDDEPPPPADGATVGIDVGIRNLAFVSDGRRYPNSQPLKSALSDLRRVDKAIARSLNIHGRNKFSRRRSRLYHRRRVLHERIANIRRTSHRAVAADIAKSAGRVVVESLNVAGIVKNLGRPASDSALGGLLREIAWQCEKRGVELVEANQWFPSSKTCSRCGVKNNIRRGARMFSCANCGYRADRDANAALNLKNCNWFAYEPRRRDAVRPPGRAAGVNEARASKTDALEPACNYQPMLIP